MPPALAASPVDLTARDADPLLGWASLERSMQDVGLTGVPGTAPSILPAQRLDDVDVSIGWTESEARQRWRQQPAVTGG